MNKYNHWDMTQDEENILWLGFNRKDAALNSINEEVLDELNSLLQDISADKKAQGLVIYSLKEKGFIAGADVNAFSKFETSAQMLEFLQKGQAVFSRLAALTIPTVALINGFCMGGGYELALACNYRVAADTQDTRIGLPEVMLGIHPGWGGTVRLPQLIGGFKALSEIILTGRAVSAARAKELGMVDDVVAVRQLKRAAIYFIKTKPAKHQPSMIDKLSNNTWVRKPLAALMRHKVSNILRKEHYPAPFAALDLWEKEGASGDRAYLKEVDSIEHLVTQGETSKNLIRAFLLRERLKGFAKNSDFRAKHVHVIGAGIMGGDIAAWCALRGIRVTLQDQTYDKIAPAIGRAHALYKKKLRKPRLIQTAMDNLIPDPQGRGIARADVIIEAVFENLEVKQEIMKRVETEAQKDAIIATNTSSIPLDEIGSAMKNPQRLVGIHFFNPVAKMDLVEVVSGAKTTKKMVDSACSFVNQIAKLPLPVQSSPGFLVNRVLMPYLLECVRLLDEGYSGETIDEAALDFGMMMGPVELADTVGMDVCLAVAENLTKHFGGTVPQKLRDMVASGKLGRKTGQGFYTYKKGKAVKGKAASNGDKGMIADRLISCIINESTACLNEGVVADADLLDAGMIFGTGFAPFRGGPLNYARNAGKEPLITSEKKPKVKGEPLKMDAVSDN
jgi:3-hydroxyacyl-CoA dehydrogenase/enoyl-CoA hydratase/3-hydroxybutyryl-CoA epimerase